jgi:outer membrane lipoprotein SlyB
MNAAISPMGSMPTGASNATKPLWAIIGVLGVSVLAMGASLVHINKRPAEPTAAIMTPSVNQLFSPSAGNNLATPSKDAVITETADGKEISPAGKAKENTARPAAKTVAKTTTAKAATPSTPVAAAATAQPAAQPVIAQAPAPVPVPAKPVCANCGTIESVTPVTRKGHGSGVGIIAGGVAGAVLGNQVGQGNGRTAATVLGAVGGGWAGNAIEKNIKKETIYSVQVRMEDGSVRTTQQATAPAVGAKVTVDGGTLRSSDGAVYAPAPAEQQRARAPQAQPQRDVYSGGS